MKSGRLLTARHEAFILMRAFRRTRDRLDRSEREQVAAGTLGDRERRELRELHRWNARRLDAAEALLREADRWRVRQLRPDPRILVRWLREREDGTWERVWGAERVSSRPSGPEAGWRSQPS